MVVPPELFAVTRGFDLVSFETSLPSWLPSVEYYHKRFIFCQPPSEYSQALVLRSMA